MASDRPLRAAHVGLSTGHAGSFDDSKPRLIHDVRRLEGVEVVAYCETYDSSFLDDAKKHNPGAGLYSSLDDMLAKEEFDFAAVVLHPADVAPALLKLAEAGKHFMVDKQFARKSEELIPVTKAVLRNNLTTFMLYPWRYHPAALDIRRLIEEDVLGEPVDIESRQFWGQVGGPLGKDINAPAHRLDTEGGGVLHYIGCHHLDLMRAVMGCEVKSVQAMTGRPFGHMEEPMEDIAVLGLEYENGGFGSLHHGYTKPITVGDQATTAPSCCAASTAGRSGRRWAATSSRSPARRPSGGARRRRRSRTTSRHCPASSDTSGTTSGSSSSPTTFAPAGPDGRTWWTACTSSRASTPPTSRPARARESTSGTAWTCSVRPRGRLPASQKRLT